MPEGLKKRLEAFLERAEKNGGQIPEAELDRGRVNKPISHALGETIRLVSTDSPGRQKAAISEVNRSLSCIPHFVLKIFEFPRLISGTFLNK